MRRLPIRVRLAVAFAVAMTIVLTAAGALFILAGVIANMHIYFQPATLFHTLVMLILLVGGLGLLVLNVALWAVCYRLLKSGWKIKN